MGNCLFVLASLVAVSVNSLTCISPYTPPATTHTHPMLACTREAYTHMRKKQTAYLIFACDFSFILFVHLLFHFPSEKSLILFCFNVYGLILKKTKRAPKVEVGTGTTDASLDEWLQVCSFCIIIIIHESFPTVLSFHSFHDLHFYFVIFLSFLLLAWSEDENLLSFRYKSWV